MNTNLPFSSACPDCGAPLTSDSPHALCAACLMRQALASRTIPQQGEAPSLTSPASPEEIAGKFPQFEILECLGRGGMGVVYKARQKSLNRLVAIKILAPERDHESRFADRFAREAELLAKLNHPHIVTIHDFGETEGLFYLVMEFVDGVNLRDLLRDGKLEAQQALAIVPPICEALQYAHGKGIVHRDIKPENLLLDREGRIKIADFGIASLIGSGNELSGTPPYMAPEQEKSSANIDHRADIYALGVVLYEMLTGERPAKNWIAPSGRAGIDARIDEMVLRALESDPERRYQNADEFRTVIETMRSEASSAPPSPPPVDVVQKGMWRSYWWLPLVMIPLGLMLGLAVGSVWSYIAPRKYVSSAVIEIQRQRGETKARALDLPLVLKRVADRIDLDRRWGMNGSARRLQGMVAVESLRGAEALSAIRVNSTNREEAREIVDAVVQVIQETTKVVVHENGVVPTTPVSPNVPLILLISAGAGVLSALVSAVPVMVFLHRRRTKGKGILPKLGWSVAAVGGLAIVVMVYRDQTQQLPPTSSLSPRFTSPEIGRIKFHYHGEAGENMGGVGTAFGVKQGGDTQWVPDGGQPFIFSGRSVRVRSRAVCDPDGKSILASAAISEDGITWRSEDALIEATETGSEKIIVLPNLIRVRIEWTPLPKGRN